MRVSRSRWRKSFERFQDSTGCIGSAPWEHPHVQSVRRSPRLRSCLPTDVQFLSGSTSRGADAHFRTMRRAGGFALVVAILAACASPAPRPSTTVGPTPTSAPVLTCDLAPPEWPIHCDQAVKAALTVVPADHPRILAIEFSYDRFGTRVCPEKSSCGGYDFAHRAAKVIFTVRASGQTTLMSVYVETNTAGGVTSLGPWWPYPV